MAEPAAPAPTMAAPSHPLRQAPSSAAAKPNPSDAAMSLPRPRLLVVRDSIFVIMTLEARCQKLDWDMVGPATRIDEGLRMARDESFDAALLDVNLDGEMSWAIAAVLAARGMPFAFGKGYDICSVLPAEFAGTQIFNKPFRMADVERRLTLLLAQERAGQS